MRLWLTFILSLTAANLLFFYRMLPISLLAVNIPAIESQFSSDVLPLIVRHVLSQTFVVPHNGLCRLGLKIEKIRSGHCTIGVALTDHTQVIFRTRVSDAFVFRQSQYQRRSYDDFSLFAFDAVADSANHLFTVSIQPGEGCDSSIGIREALFPRHSTFALHEGSKRKAAEMEMQFGFCDNR